MDLYIRNKNYEIIKVIRNADSVIWKKSYNDVGQCAFTIPVSSVLFDVIANGHYITREDDDMVCIIKQITITTNRDTNMHTYQVVGLDMLYVLSQRIVWKMEDFNGNVENAIRDIIEHNCINTTNYGGNNRKIENFELDTKYGFTETFEKQVTYDNVLDCVLAICKQFDYGIKVYYSNGTFKLKLYNGVDRSEAQIINPYVVFSDNNHNLATSQYFMDASTYKNTALVGGKGEGTARTLVTVNDSLRGLNRYETFVDASSLEETTNYQKQLTQHGQEQLKTLTVQETFDGDIKNTNLYKYKEHFNLGDIVSVRNNLGISKNSRIRSVTESYDINGEDVTLSFS